MPFNTAQNLFTSASFSPILIPKKVLKATRYGFNGKMKDNEVEGEGDVYDYGARMYDSRLGRFLSVDPLTKKFPMLTPYQFASNSPIDGTDLDGKEHYKVKATDLGDGATQIVVSLAPNGLREAFRVDLNEQQVSKTDNDWGKADLQKNLGSLYKGKDGNLYRNDSKGNPVRQNGFSVAGQNGDQWSQSFTIQKPMNEMQDNTYHTEIADVPNPVVTVEGGSNFGDIQSGSKTISYTTPASSTPPVLSIEYSDVGALKNSFTVTDNNGNQLMPTQTGSGTASFSVHSGTTVNINVTGKGGDKADLYNVTLSVQTTHKEEKQVVDKPTE